MEVKSNGDLVIAGSQIGTSSSNYSIKSGQSFDGFDFAEIFECDMPYDAGTVVCPHEILDVMTLCTHENCFAASVISGNPAFIFGGAYPESDLLLPVTLVGRINVKTSVPIAKRTMVVSDGKGGVLPVNKQENGYVIGIALNEAVSGQVGILLRSMRAESKP